MQISDEKKLWIVENLKYDKKTGALTWADDVRVCDLNRSAVKRRILPLSGIVERFVHDDVHGDLDAASVCWLINKGQWPEHGVNVVDQSLKDGEVLKASNLRKRSRAAMVKSQVVTCERNELVDWVDVLQKCTDFAVFQQGNAASEHLKALLDLMARVRKVLGS